MIISVYPLKCSSESWTFTFLKTLKHLIFKNNFEFLKDIILHLAGCVVPTKTQYLALPKFLQC